MREHSSLSRDADLSIHLNHRFEKAFSRQIKDHLVIDLVNEVHCLIELLMDVEK